MIAALKHETKEQRLPGEGWGWWVVVVGSTQTAGPSLYACVEIKRSQAKPPNRRGSRRTV